MGRAANSGVILVDIPANDDKATISVNPGPLNSQGTVQATLEPTGDGWSGNDTLDSYAIGAQASGTTALPGSTTPITVGNMAEENFQVNPETAGDYLDRCRFEVGISVNQFVPDPSIGWSNISWTTVDGTAKAGVDHGQSSGSTSSESSDPGSTATASHPDLPLRQRGRQVILTLWSPPPLNGTDTWVVPVQFANPTLYLYGDTNGDGQLTLNDDDPPSNTSLTSSTPITVPVLQVDPTDAASATAIGNASMATDGLVAVHIGASAGPNSTLTLKETGDDTVLAWLSPKESGLPRTLPTA